MNRAERRAYAKRMKKMGANSTEVMKLLELQKAGTRLTQGTKVKLNYDKIVNDSGYADKTQWFRDFVENNKDTVFTVQLDDQYNKMNSNIFVRLAEDTSEPKWLWFASDLIPIEEKTNG
jgi:hypothetical protein